MGDLAVFEVHENESDAKPIAYLAINGINWSNDASDGNPPCFCRSMALADEVSGWESGKIQALLLNRIFGNEYDDDMESSKRDFIAFDESVGSRKIKASC